jgi:hypothetical protein
VEPLSEWTTEELWDCLFTQDEDSPRYYWDEKSPVSQREALAELLRRERAKCLGVVESVEQTIRAFMLDTTDAETRHRLADKLSVVCSIRDAMRGLR